MSLLSRAATTLGQVRRAMSDTDERNLKQKVFASGLLSVATFGTRVCLRLGSTIILTRILAPDVFGVFAVVLAALFILELMSDLGLRPLVLTREGEVETGFLHACWTMQIARGLLVCLMMLGMGELIRHLQQTGAFPVESSYSALELPALMMVIGLTSLINGFQSLNRFLYERRMSFNRIAYFEISSDIARFVLVVSMTYYLQSIWGLAFALILNASAKTITSYVFFSGSQMHPNIEWRHVGVIIERGKWIMGQSGLMGLIKISDRVMLGLFLPAAEFGFYYIARQFFDLVTTFLQQMHARMGLQVFKELQKRVVGISQRYYRYRIPFDAVAMLACGTLLTVAPLMVEILYDDRYRSVAPILQVLAIGLPLIGPALIGAAFNAQRRFKITAALQLVSAVTIWTGLYLALVVHDDQVAAFAVIALHRVPELLIMLALGRREGWVVPWKELRLTPLIAIGMGLGLGIDALWSALAINSAG